MRHDDAYEAYEPATRDGRRGAEGGGQIDNQAYPVGRIPGWSPLRPHGEDVE